MFCENYVLGSILKKLWVSFRDFVFWSGRWILVRVFYNFFVESNKVVKLTFDISYGSRRLLFLRIICVYNFNVSCVVCF